jgi:hypothetical protein
MTIEIKQMIIRATVQARPDGGQRPDSPDSIAASSPAPRRIEPGPVVLAEQRQALVSACVREVLRELRKARER